MTTIYSFGPFRLDVEAGILFRGAEPVALGQRAVALLQILAEEGGSPISKDRLIESAWPGLAIEESNLPVQIAALRRVFAEEPGGDSWIETLPRRGYRYVGPVVIKKQENQGATGNEQPALALPDQPSLAVMPFTNLSGNPEQEYFADGIVEDIITDLSRIKWLFVIARNSSFIYKGQAVNVGRVGRELGVRYVLEGSVRKAGERVRITGRLIDTSTGAHLWADRFDGALGDIFDLQDRVTESVVSAVAPKLERAEIERAKRKPTESLDAYDYYLRGVASNIAYTREGDNEALRLFYRAIELDPDFAVAYGRATWIFVNRKSNGWMTDRALEIAEAARLGRRAVELGDDDAAALSWGGFALAYFAHELDDGIAYIDRALVLNPNLAAAWYVSAWVRVFFGDPEDAIERLGRAIRLSPLDPLIFRMHAGIAYAHFFAGRYDEASSWAEKAVRAWPTWLTAVRGAAASHALAGRLDEARKHMTRMRELDPHCAFPISRICSRCAEWRIAPNGPKLCEQQGCRSNRCLMSVNDSVDGSSTGT
jgi:TolB-like protein